MPLLPERDRLWDPRATNISLLSERASRMDIDCPPSVPQLSGTLTLLISLSLR